MATEVYGIHNIGRPLKFVWNLKPKEKNYQQRYLLNSYVISVNNLLFCILKYIYFLRKTTNHIKPFCTNTPIRLHQRQHPKMSQFLCKYVHSFRSLLYLSISSLCAKHAVQLYLLSSAIILWTVNIISIFFFVCSVGKGIFFYFAE